MLKKIIKIFFYLTLFYTFVGFIALPLFLKPQVVKIVSQNTNSKISLESIYFNPFIFKLQVDGIKLHSLDNKELISLKTMVFNFEPYSLFYSAIHVKNFTLVEPKISLVLDKDKNINLSSIVKENRHAKTEEQNSEIKIPRIILDNIAMEDGIINYEDYSNPSKFDFKLCDISFSLKDIDTDDFNTSDATIKFHTLLDDGGFVNFKGNIVGFKPFIVNGNLDFEASKLYTQWRYMKDTLNLEVADGKLSFYTDYYFNLEDINATSLTNLSVNINKLRIKPKSKYKDILNLDLLSIQDVSVKPFVKDILIGKVILNSLDIKAKRDNSKKIDWLKYIQTNSNTKKTNNDKKDTNTTEPWNVLVKNIALEKIKLDFNDEGISPHVNTSLNELNLYAQEVTLLGEEPFSYQADFFINKNFRCNTQGSISHNNLNINSYTKCNDFNIVHYQPYIDDIAKNNLQTYDLKLQSFIAGFDANVSVKDINSTIVVDVNNANINLDKLKLNKKSTNEKLVSFNSFLIKNISLNTKTKKIIVNDTQMNNLHIETSKLKDGNLNIKDLVVTKDKLKNQKKSKNQKKEEKYQVKLKKVSLKNASINFQDKSLQPTVSNKISNIYLNAYDIDSNKNTWLKYKISALLNNTGKINSNGKIRHTPLKQKGKFELNKISLKAITPYLNQFTYLRLDDGYLSLKTKTNYAPSKIRADLTLNGSVKIEEFFLNDSRNYNSVLSFSEIDLKKFTYEMSPDRLFIDDIDVNSFYVNAIIDEKKQMNFSSLVKPNKQKVKKKKISQKDKKEPMPIKIMKINVRDGSANFEDKSLPIKFKTNIHDLNGVIYAISTTPNETSYVDITGEIDRYGSTKLKGSINPSNPKAFTDLNLNFRNLNLPSMSGYSGSFAGYKIDNGKLFLDLNYDIYDSKLLGKNSIIIKKIKLGDEIENENNSSLPLGFVIALLEDSDGVIDIDMPVKGNVDEPDFKYGKLVMQTLGNLILKAVASPFKFLGSMMGIDGDKLEFVEFELGSYKILPSEQEKLDNIAKLFIKRPKISLNIFGSYDKELDKKSIQKVKLVNIVIKRSGSKNEKEKINAMTIDLLEDIYKEAKADNKLQTIKDKLSKKYKDKEFQREYFDALVEECLALQTVSQDELNELANKRVQAIKEYLVNNKGIKSSRIHIDKVLELSNEDSKIIKSKLTIIVK